MSTAETSDQTLAAALRPLHADEVVARPDTVRRLLTDQFPDWAGLDLEPVVHDGTDHIIYRLGSELSVRMPRVGWATNQVDTDGRWLADLAPKVPLAIPRQVGVGEAGHGFPWAWSVHTWIKGADAGPHTLDDLDQAAHDLADFIHQLRAAVPGDARLGAKLLLAEKSDEVEGALKRCRQLAPEDQPAIDYDDVAKTWALALAARPFEGEPAWSHGDLSSRNLLAEGGRLVGVIDFGPVGRSDPAIELLAAWDIFTGPSRAVFRDAVRADDDAWARGRGWALVMGLSGLYYYAESNPGFAVFARRLIEHATHDAMGRS